MTERLGPHRLVLSLSILGAGAALEIEAEAPVLEVEPMVLSAESAPEVEIAAEPEEELVLVDPSSVVLPPPSNEQRHCAPMPWSPHSPKS